MAGTPKYASRCRLWFMQSVATRSPGRIPSRCSPAASRRARSATAA